MRCPFCGKIEDRVIDSRESKDGDTVRRRRVCLSCSRRFTTYEKIDEIGFQVVKKDERREPYSREKLLSGLRKACQKRPVRSAALESIADEVESRLHTKTEREVTTSEVGSLVMERLRDLDKVAYVRFASVYREFEDVTQFLNELKGLLDTQGGRRRARTKK